MMKGFGFNKTNEATASPVTGQVEESVPSGWNRIMSKSQGKAYYQNITTGETKWDRPDAKASTISPPTTGTGSGMMGFRAGLTSGLNVFSKKVTAAASAAATASQNTVNEFKAKNGTRLQRTVSDSGGRPSGEEERADSFKTSGEFDNGPLEEEQFENGRLDQDGQLNDQEDPRQYSDVGAGVGSGQDTRMEFPLAREYVWTSEWELDLDFANVDEDGWTYGTDFDDLLRLQEDEMTRGKRERDDAVRRRRWIRVQQHRSVLETTESMTESTIPDALIEPSLSTQESHTSQEGNPLSDDSGDDEEENDKEEEEEPSLAPMDPFTKVQAAKAATSASGATYFKKKLNFPGALRKKEMDATKEYQNLGVTNSWLVTTPEVTETSRAELVAKTSALAARLSTAASKSVDLQKSLVSKHAISITRCDEVNAKLASTVTTYSKLVVTRDKLHRSVSELRKSVASLTKEVTKLDTAQNAEIRAANDEVEVSNQLLSDRAKALATARQRLKQDSATLQGQLLDPSQDTVADRARQKDIRKLKRAIGKAMLKRDRKLTRCETLEEEKAQVVYQEVTRRAEQRLEMTRKLSASLATVEVAIKVIKAEQSKIVKAYSQNVEPSTQRQIDQRRNAIRTELSQLREQRRSLLAQRKKEDSAL